MRLRRSGRGQAPASARDRMYSPLPHATAPPLLPIDDTERQLPDQLGDAISVDKQLGEIVTAQIYILQTVIRPSNGPSNAPSNRPSNTTTTHPPVEYIFRMGSQRPIFLPPCSTDSRKQQRSRSTVNSQSRGSSQLQLASDPARSGPIHSCGSVGSV